MSSSSKMSPTAVWVLQGTPKVQPHNLPCIQQKRGASLRDLSLGQMVVWVQFKQSSILEDSDIIRCVFKYIVVYSQFDWLVLLRTGGCLVGS